MNNVAPHELLAQADSADLGETFEGFMRTAARTAFMNVLCDEVARLCGPAYHPSPEAVHERAGSAPGRYFFGTEEERIRRPRVRKNGQEVPLKAYETAQDRGALQDAMIRAFMGGLPSREQKRLFKNTSCNSRSEVSRLWQKEGLRCIQELRQRDLAAEDYVVLMLDGIGLGDDLCAIVALGITEKGEKHILDFQIGASENAEASSDLLARLVDRGFQPRRRLLAVTDGSKALRKAIRTRCPDTIVQRCLVHKARNIKGYMSRRYHGEIDRLFARLRKAEGPEAAEEARDDLRRFLKGKSAAALASLEEAGDELVAVHQLGAPSTLNSTLLNTNCIENPFRNVRAKTRRVTRWRGETKMASKWLAYALLEAERGFRRINHYADMGELVRCIEKIAPPPPEEGVEAIAALDATRQEDYTSNQ
jgi:putative transposase